MVTWWQLFNLDFQFIQLQWMQTQFKFGCKCILVRWDLAVPEPTLQMVLVCGAHAPVFPKAKVFKRKKVAA